MQNETLTVSSSFAWAIGTALVSVGGAYATVRVTMRWLESRVTSLEQWREKQSLADLAMAQALGRLEAVDERSERIENRLDELNRHLLAKIP